MKRAYLYLLLGLVLFTGCAGEPQDASSFTWAAASVSDEKAPETFADSLSNAAISLTQEDVRYDPSYYSIDYPGGDVPADIGVCTDVVIRAYRKVGIDLQVAVHEDMVISFDAYPTIWGAKRTDTNIDHRRVPNLMTYFERMKGKVATTESSDDYLAGDIVCWDLGGAITHIGVVVDANSSDGKRPLIAHNIGAGQVLEDCLFRFTQIGHYRYPSRD